MCGSNNSFNMGGCAGYLDTSRWIGSGCGFNTRVYNVCGYPNKSMGCGSDGCGGYRYTNRGCGYSGC